jgi:chromate reductase
MSLKGIGVKVWLNQSRFLVSLVMRTALESLPDGTKLEIFDIAEFPPFNQDLEQTPPEVVKDFKAKIRAADAILIASPEYNYSIPGVLKNAIDWASRPFNENPFDGKPVAIMSASTGRLGGARMQYHLRQTFIFLNMYPLNRPEFMVPKAQEHFNSEVKLTDEETRQRLRELLEALAKWTLKLKEKTH